MSKVLVPLVFSASRWPRSLGPVVRIISRRDRVYHERRACYHGLSRTSAHSNLGKPKKISSFRRCLSVGSHQTPEESAKPESRTVSWNVENKEIEFAYIGESPRQYPLFWLKDHCQCSDCTHPQTKQRQINTFDIPEDLSARSVEPEDAGVRVIWNPDSHESFYPWTWLRQHRPVCTPSPSTRAWEHMKPSLNDTTYPTTSFNSIMDRGSATGLSKWLSQIHKYGFSFISDTPPTPEATQKLLERIAFIRPTHYGGFWDFKSSPSPTDTAYTNLGLPVHTDTTYFTDPCGLQLFHVLQPATIRGGQSTLVDGFAAAEYLYHSLPSAYKALSEQRIVSHASGNSQVGKIDNTVANPRGYPILSHSGGPDTERNAMNPSTLRQIRWNNDDRHSSTQFSSRDQMERWYDAASEWAKVLQMPEFEIEVQLQPGMPVIFDNWRVLHGRRAFEGERRVCGGYIGMDDFMARWRSVSGE